MYNAPYARRVPLVTGEFQTITLLPLTDPAWVALTPKPNLPRIVVEALSLGVPFEAYVVDAPTGYLVTIEGEAFGIVDSVCASVGAAWPRFTFTSFYSGTTTQWGLSTMLAVYVYSAASTRLEWYDNPDAVALKAFLP